MKEYKFIGKDGSLGYKNGQVYDLELVDTGNEVIIEHPFKCIYSSDKMFLENWEVVELNNENKKWEKEFFERFGANKIWVNPSKENVETVLEIWGFISKVEESASQSAYDKAIEVIEEHLKVISGMPFPNVYATRESIESEITKLKNK